MANHREHSYPRIAVAAPTLNGNEKRYVLECLETTWISSIGRFINEFERAFARFCGVEHAVAVNNGTTALHLALVALGLKPGDEVLVPTLTYIATANAVTYCGAKPILVDCDPRTLNMDPTTIASKITTRTKGIIPVHLYGHPVDMDPIVSAAREYGLFVLEDASVVWPLARHSAFLATRSSPPAKAGWSQQTMAIWPRSFGYTVVRDWLQGAVIGIR